MKFAIFNAKAETVTTAASFKGARKAGRRCLVVTDRFYEWRKGDKQPFAIACAGDLTVVAGLWEKWRSPARERINSCTVITTAANDLIAPLRDRMPVILAPDDWRIWGVVLGGMVVSVVVITLLKNRQYAWTIPALCVLVALAPASLSDLY